MNFNLSFLTQSPTSFTGTANELQQKGVKINGQAVDAVTLSILHKYNIVETVGFKEKAAKTRGRAPAIFSLKSSDNFKVSL